MERLESLVLGNFLIGLREGVEAALIISILLTYLVRTGRTHLVTHVWRGVALAVGASVALAIGLETLASSLGPTAEPIFTGAISFVAVAFVTWMIFWIKRTASTIAGDLRGRLDHAAAAGTTTAVTLMSFVAVVREGSETALFFWAAAHAAGQQVAAVLGLLGGLAAAVIVGWGLFRSTRQVNMRKLFQVTGALLVFIAAGVLSYAIAEWQEVGLLPGANAVALDLSAWLTADSWLTVAAGGMFNLHPVTTWLQVAGYAAYVCVVLPLIVRAPRPAAESLSSPAHSVSV